MELPAHTRDRIAEIKALHVPDRIRVPGRWFKVDGCRYCRVRYPCLQRRWAARVEAGLIDPAGWRP
jgi:hypothetical protein